MLNKVTTVAENTICDYFRDICGWSLKEIMDLVENLHMNGKVGDKAFGLMSNLDRKFLEVVMASAAQVAADDGGNQYDDDQYAEDMDGDHESAFESAGWGTDESYGDYDSGMDF